MSLSKKETIVKLNKIKNLIESSNRLNEAVDNNLVKEFKNSFKNCQTISSKFVKLNQTLANKAAAFDKYYKKFDVVLNKYMKNPDKYTDELDTAINDLEAAAEVVEEFIYDINSNISELNKYIKLN